MDSFLTILTVVAKVLGLIFTFYYAFKVDKAYKNKESTNKELIYNGVWLLFFTVVVTSF